MRSFWAFGVARDYVGQFLLPGGPAKSGWTSRRPLADISDSPLPQSPIQCQTFGLIGFIFLILVSLLGAVNFIRPSFTARQGTDLDAAPAFSSGPSVFSAFLFLAGISAAEGGNRHAVMARVAAHQSFFLPAAWS